MGAPQDTNLVSNYRLNFTTKYKRTDIGLNQKDLKDDLDYSDISGQLRNGRGVDAANLQYYSRRTLVNATETFDLDGVLTNFWGQTLDYDAVKILIIKNRETASNRYLEVQFKNERYYIGPNGSRVLIEPDGTGLQAIVSSSSGEEGTLTVSSNASITYDIIIIGSDKEASSSSTSGV